MWTGRVSVRFFDLGVSRLPFFLFYQFPRSRPWVRHSSYYVRSNCFFFFFLSKSPVLRSTQHQHQHHLQFAPDPVEPSCGRVPVLRTHQKQNNNKKVVDVRAQPYLPPRHSAQPALAIQDVRSERTSGEPEDLIFVTRRK